MLRGINEVVLKMSDLLHTIAVVSGLFLHGFKCAVCAAFLLAQPSRDIILPGLLQQTRVPPMASGAGHGDGVAL